MPSGKGAGEPSDAWVRQCLTAPAGWESSVLGLSRLQVAPEGPTGPHSGPRTSVRQPLLDVPCLPRFCDQLWWRELRASVSIKSCGARWFGSRAPWHMQSPLLESLARVPGNADLTGCQAVGAAGVRARRRSQNRYGKVDAASEHGLYGLQQLGLVCGFGEVAPGAPPDR